MSAQADDDAIFQEIVSDLKVDTSGDGVIDVTVLAKKELLDVITACRGELRQIGEFHIEPRTERGRELRSLLAAADDELRLRQRHNL